MWPRAHTMPLMLVPRRAHRTPEARELLADVDGRFTEGFHTADYARAGALLLELSASR